MAADGREGSGEGRDGATGAAGGSSAARGDDAYARAGVSIAAGDALVERIKPAAARTARPGVMAGLGGFGALFDLAATGYRDPVLVAATDGVGTKLKLAFATGAVRGIGQDLVAMCVNDLICQGAEPLFFLDYFATGVLEPGVAAAVIEGVAEACAASGCALIGGETAEMPGVYAAGEFDLAGFAVGAVERDRVLPRASQAGDAVIGVASSGPHSNGYSLIRRVVAEAELGWGAPAPFQSGASLGAALLTPTRLYVDAARAVLARHGDATRGLAHITGGGLTENLPRCLTPGQSAEIDLGAWPRADVFAWLGRAGGLSDPDMLRTFNCGVGLAIICAAEAARGVCETLAAAGHEAWEIGRVVATEPEAAARTRFVGRLFP